MTQWLRGRTLFERASLALLVLAAVTFVVSLFSAGNSSSGFLSIALVVCFYAFRKELLWRVRSRLVMTFFLFGVVPLFLIGFSLVLVTELMFGQFATQRTRQDLDAQIKSVHASAQTLAAAASRNAAPGLLGAILNNQPAPELEAVVAGSGGAELIRSGAGFQTAPAWIAPGFDGLFESGGHYYLGSRVREDSADAFTCIPFDTQSVSKLTHGAVSGAAILKGDDRTDIAFGFSGTTITVFENGTGRLIVPSGLAPSHGWWDVPIAGMLAAQATTAKGPAAIVVLIVARPSALIAGVMTGRMTSIVLSMLAALAGMFLLVEAASLFSSLRITRAITNSVDDLYRGTLQVAQGDFSHQIPVRGEHQLSELATSFNSMTSKIHQLIGEVKKKEKLDAELEIARQVQLRLFPKSVPKLKTLEMAGVCIPGRVVSGDYYDYVKLDDRWTAIALGDVSGKGVSAALLMASIQSALHAQLKSNPAGPHPSTLMALIGQQLYENTPPEKYATFFLSVYDDQTGTLTYTNAGHLKPILVRNGKATTLEGDGMVAGLLPDVQYDQQDITLQKGDLIAIFSDGIPEAEDAKQQEFSEARLAELLVPRSADPLDQIIPAVTGTVGKWIYDPEGRDDLTLLLLRKL